MATFNGTEGGAIPLPVAKEWTANYRATIKQGDTLAHFFGQDIIRKILEEDGCVGIRIYYAINDKGQKQLLLVGAAENGDNILPTENAAASPEDDGPIIADMSKPCPTYCPGNGI
jgi:hypothetical protein